MGSNFLLNHAFSSRLKFVDLHFPHVLRPTGSWHTMSEKELGPFVDCDGSPRGLSLRIEHCLFGGLLSSCYISVKIHVQWVQVVSWPRLLCAGWDDCLISLSLSLFVCVSDFLYWRLRVVSWTTKKLGAKRQEERSWASSTEHATRVYKIKKNLAKNWVLCLVRAWEWACGVCFGIACSFRSSHCDHRSFSYLYQRPECVSFMFLVIFFFTSMRAVENHVPERTQYLIKLSYLTLTNNGHTPRKFVNLLVMLNVLTPVGKNCILIIHALQSADLTPFLCWESMVVLAFQAFTFPFSQNQCRAGPIAMYVCLFFSQMRKINAGG